MFSKLREFLADNGHENESNIFLDFYNKRICIYGDVCSGKVNDEDIITYQEYDGYSFELFENGLKENKD